MSRGSHKKEDEHYYEPMWIKEEYKYQRKNHQTNGRRLSSAASCYKIFFVVFVVVTLVSFLLLARRTKKEVVLNEVEHVGVKSGSDFDHDSNKRVSSVVRAMKQIGEWPVKKKGKILIVGDEIEGCADLSSSIASAVMEEHTSLVFVNLHPKVRQTMDSRLDIRTSLSDVHTGEFFSRGIAIGCLSASNMRPFRVGVETMLSKLPDETPFVVILSSEGNTKKTKLAWLASVFQKLVPEAQQFYAMDSVEPEVFLLFGVKVL